MSCDLTDPRKTWKNINNILYNIDSIEVDPCEKIIVSGLTLTDKTVIADHFNESFVSTATTVKKLIRFDTRSAEYYRDIDDYQINSPFVGIETSEEEILNIISNLKFFGC